MVLNKTAAGRRSMPLARSLVSRIIWPRGQMDKRVGRARNSSGHRGRRPPFGRPARPARLACGRGVNFFITSQPAGRPASRPAGARPTAEATNGTRSNALVTNDTFQTTHSWARTNALLGAPTEAHPFAAGPFGRRPPARRDTRAADSSSSSAGGGPLGDTLLAPNWPRAAAAVAAAAAGAGGPNLTWRWRGAAPSVLIVRPGRARSL